MKKIVFITAMFLLIVQGGIAQTVNRLFNQFEDQPGAEYENVGPLLIGIAKVLSSDDSEETKILKSIKSVKVLSVKDCTTETKQEFARKVRNFKPRNMDLLMLIKKGNKNLSIWGEIKKILYAN